MSRKLRPRHLKAVHMLASGKSSAFIARELKLRRETLSRWKRWPEFNQELEKVMNDLRQRLRYRLAQLAERALVALESDMDSHYNGGKRAQMALNMIKVLGSEQFAMQCVPKTGPELAENGPDASAETPSAPESTNP